MLDELEDIFDDDDSIEYTYLVFHLQGERYAVRVASVNEIVRMSELATLPDVPHYIKGVMSLRGRIVPVMDMRLRCGLEEQEYNDRTVVVVLEFEGKSCGLVVDSVVEVVELPPELVSDAPVASAAASVVTGLAQREEQVYILLNVERLLLSTESLNLAVSQ